MISIALCICTRNRQEGIRRLLESFDKMEIPPDTGITIIVVENDQTNRSEEVIKEYSSFGRFKIKYFLETKQGLVYARNRSVLEAGNCDFCCFTDDDEIVSPDWLSELLRCQKEYDADGVAGPTFPLFSKPLPSYISDFHLPRTNPYGTVVSNAYTGCLLMRKHFLDKLNGPFDERLNFTGGEDIHMTQIITNMGGVIRYNPEAKAFEDFPENRETVKYILQRSYRNANTGLFARTLIYGNRYLLKNLPRLILRLGNGLLTFIPFYIKGGKNKLKGLIKIVNAAGGLHFILGRKNRFYK